MEMRFELLLVGAMLGGVILYLTCAFYFRARVHVLELTEIGLCAAGIAGGLYVAYGAFSPSSLIELLDDRGMRVELPDHVTVTLNSYVYLHLLASGMVTCVISAGALAHFCNGLRQRASVQRDVSSLLTFGLMFAGVGLLVSLTAFIGDIAGLPSVPPLVSATLFSLSLGILASVGSTVGRNNTREPKS